MLSQQWETIVWPGSQEALSSVDITTGVAKDILKRVGQASVWIPEGFEVHPKVVRHVKNRIASLDKEKGLDWATAEVRILFFSDSDGRCYRKICLPIGSGIWFADA